MENINLDRFKKALGKLTHTEVCGLCDFLPKWVAESQSRGGAETNAVVALMIDVMEYAVKRVGV